MTSLLRRHRFVAAGALVAAAGALTLPLAAQGRGDRGAGAGAGAGKQSIAFVALAADGEPVPSLTPDKIELKIDGKVRTVQSLKMVKGPADAPVALKALVSGTPPPPYGTNPSQYYVGEFGADAIDAVAKAHQIEMRSTMPGVTVRAGNELSFAKGTSGARLQAKDLVKEAKIYTDLPIRVAARAVRDTGDTMRIVVLLQPVDASAKFGSASVGLVDSSNKMITAAATPDDLGKPIVSVSFSVNPGTYRVHAVAVDAAGKTGSADFPIEARLITVGPMRMGGIQLGSPNVAGGPATPRMEFSDEPDVAAQVDLYGSTASGLSVAFELAETIDGPATLTILDPSQMQIQPTSEPDHFTITAKIPTKDLKAGDYVVRAVLNLPNLPPGKAMRTLRKAK